MTSALEAPLEVLALGSLSYGFLSAINNLWAWVAAITGAISFLLTFRKPALSITGTDIPDPKTRFLDPVPKPDKSLYSSVASTYAPSPALTFIAGEEALDLTTRRKFVVHYQDDVMAEAREEYDADCSKVWDNINELSLSRVEPALAPLVEWEWDLMMRMRILTGEEMRWYRYQDLRVLNGNVVRLWESCR